MSMLNKTLGRGYGDNSLALENSLNASFPGGGYFEDFVLPQSSWTNQTLVALTATPGATPYRRFSTTGTLPCIAWDTLSATTAFIVNSFTVPGEYDPQIDQLYFIAAVRKIITAGDIALGMQLRMRTHLPGSLNPTLAATAVPATTNLTAGDASVSSPAVFRRSFPVGAAETVVSSFALMQFDLGNDKRGTITDLLRIKPLETISLEFGPDVAVPATTTIEMAGGGIVRWVRNASLANRDRRFSTDAGLLSSNGSNRYIH